MKATGVCQTRNVVHVIECTKCSTQYAEQTKSVLRVCLMGDQSDIRHKPVEKPVAKHFNSVDHLIKDLTMMVIEMIHKEDMEHRKRKESHWTEMIRSLTLDGLNLYL